MRRIRNCTLLVVISWGFLMPAESLPVVVRQMNLDDLTTSARYIFSGLCTGSEIRYDAETGREAVFVTFQIVKMLKGEGLDEMTFKMSRVAVDIARAPTFSSGDEAILFLYERSPLGFTSPVGLGQGAFAVRSAAGGEKVVVNGNNNSNLFRGIDITRYAERKAGSSFLAALDQAMLQQSGPINYQTFITLVEGMAGRE